MTVSGTSNQMKRLAAYLPDPVYEELERWATQEKRSLSNLVSYLLEKAIDEKQQKGDRSGDSSQGATGKE